MTTKQVKSKEAKSEFEKGKGLVMENDFLGARDHFKIAHDLDPGNARYMSYYGLSIALSEGNPQVGIELCTRAINAEPETPVFFLNLAKVYIKTKNRNSAMKTIMEGLAIDKDNPELLNLYENIGQRKSTALPFLSRNSFINIYLGRLKTFLSKL